MIKQILKQPDFTGVGQAGTATARIPTYGTHYAAILSFDNAMGAMANSDISAAVSGVRVKINGETKWDVTAEFLLMLQKYYGDSSGYGNQEGQVIIDFTHPLLSTVEERELFAIGTNGINSFNIEVDHDGTVTKIELRSEVTPETNSIGQHLTVMALPQEKTAAGIEEVSDFPGIGRADIAYNSLHFKAEYLDEYTVKIGGNDIIKSINWEVNALMLEKSGRTPQTGWNHVDFGRSNDVLNGGLLPMAGIQDFRLQNTWGAGPGNYTIFAVRIEGLNATTKTA